jgi:hypothetical protein
MNKDIRIEDGLAGEVVLIAARVLPQDDVPMDERPLMVTVGVPEKDVLILSGKLGDFEQLWREGWANYAKAVLQQEDEAEPVEGEVVATAPADEAETFVYQDEDF